MTPRPGKPYSSGREVTGAGTQPGADRPLVSVLTTSYNHARWLPDTLDSVRRQDWPRVEHVVVDDASSDGSIELLVGWPGRGLLWKTGPNQGQARALNEAFRMSSGDIIGWLSSDDVYYDRGVVSAVVDAFSMHPRAALVYGHAVLINGYGLQLQGLWVPPVRILGWRPPMRIIQPAVFVRRSVLGDRIVDDSYDVAMDTELWLRLHRSHPFVRLNRILAGERHHPARKSYTMGVVMHDEGKRLEATFGTGRGTPLHRNSRIWGVILRVAGLSLIPRMQRYPSGFRGDLDSRIALVRRQVLVRRAEMPPGPAPTRHRARGE